MTTTLTVDAAGAWAGLVQGYTKLAVISGVGVRNYYRRLGYELRGEGEFLIKDLKPQQQQQQQRGAAGDATPPPAVAGAQSTRSPERAAAAEEETEAEVSSGLAAAAACVGLTSLGLALCATLGMQSRTR
jgi:hypothetical protein